MDCIKYENISKKYGDKKVLTDLSLSIPHGSITFLLGLNGAGKTTLFRLTLGLSRPNAGSIFVSSSKSIGIVLGTPKFFERLSAYENLKYYATVWNRPIHTIQEVIELVGLSAASGKKVKSFSTGMRQRLAIARAVLMEPSLLLLDEPFSGLDPSGILGIKDLILRLQQKKNVTIVISSHLIEETKGLATDFAILHGGHIASTFSASESNERLKCIEVESFEKLERIKRSYSEVWKAVYVHDNRCLLFPNNSVENLPMIADAIRKELAIDCQIGIAGLNEYFLAITGGHNIDSDN